MVQYHTARSGVASALRAGGETAGLGVPGGALLHLLGPPSDLRLRHLQMLFCSCFIFQTLGALNSCMHRLPEINAGSTMVWHILLRAWMWDFETLDLKFCRVSPRRLRAANTDLLNKYIYIYTYMHIYLSINLSLSLSLYIYIYIYTHINKHIKHIYIYIHTHICLPIYIFLSLSIYIYICISLPLSVYLSIYIYIYIYIYYLYIHVYIYTSIRAPGSRRNHTYI